MLTMLVVLAVSSVRFHVCFDKFVELSGLLVLRSPLGGSGHSGCKAFTRFRMLRRYVS